MPLRSVFMPVVAASLSFLPYAVHAQTATEIPTLPNAPYCQPVDINEHGDVLAQCLDTSAAWLWRPFIWSTATDSITLLPPFGYFQGLDVPCIAINDSRQVLCYADDQGTLRPYLWVDGHATWLTGLRNASALNDLGEVVGYLSATDGYALRRADGTLVPLPANSELNPPTLNNLSQVAMKLNGQLYVWSPTAMVSIPSPPVSGQYGWYVVGISDGGAIAVNYWPQALVYRPTHGWTTLSLPMAFYGATISGINVLNQISGTVYDLQGPNHAVVWTSPDDLINLGTATGFTHSGATDLNAAGQVIGGACVEVPEGCRAVSLVWSLPPPPPVPVQNINNVEQHISALVATGSISTTEAEGLIAKLNGAAQAYGLNDTPAALKILKATSNQVNALVRSKRISASNAASLQELIDTAITSL